MRSAFRLDISGDNESAATLLQQHSEHIMMAATIMLLLLLNCLSGSVKSLRCNGTSLVLAWIMRVVYHAKNAAAYYHSLTAYNPASSSSSGYDGPDGRTLTMASFYFAEELIAVQSACTQGILKAYLVLLWMMDGVGEVH